MIQWGKCTGVGSYGIQWINLPITYTVVYYILAGISWAAQNNTWFTNNNPAGGAPVTDICGSIGDTDKTLAGFYIQKFSPHYWITIGS